MIKKGVNSDADSDSDELSGSDTESDFKGLTENDFNYVVQQFGFVKVPEISAYEKRLEDGKSVLLIQDGMVYIWSTSKHEVVIKGFQGKKCEVSVFSCCSFYSLMLKGERLMKCRKIPTIILCCLIFCKFLSVGTQKLGCGVFL